MATSERDLDRERPDLLDRSKKIVEMVLQLPHRAEDSGRVLEAVGEVKADLRVLENYQSLARQLASGITPGDVDQTVRQVQEAAALLNEARQLVEGAPRLSREPDPEPEAETILPSSDETTADEIQDIPVFTPPDDFISRQAGENASVDYLRTQNPIPGVQVMSHKSRGMSRRDFGGLVRGVGLALGSLVIVGELTKTTPILSWAADTLDWHPKTPEQAEDFMRKYSLSEKPVGMGDWYVMYPILERDEEFMNTFINFNFIPSDSDYQTPIYAPVGDNNPFPLQVAYATMSFGVDESKFTNPLVVVKNGPSKWYLVSGRKVPESPDQRPYPNVIQITNASNKSNFYLDVKPILVQGRNKVEIRYMKRVKTSAPEQKAPNKVN